MAAGGRARGPFLAGHCDPEPGHAHGGTGGEEALSTASPPSRVGCSGVTPSLDPHLPRNTHGSISEFFTWPGSESNSSVLKQVCAA